MPLCSVGRIALANVVCLKSPFVVENRRCGRRDSFASFLRKVKIYNLVTLTESKNRFTQSKTPHLIRTHSNKMVCIKPLN